jgi:hypothetical protein
MTATVLRVNRLIGVSKTPITRELGIEQTTTHTYVSASYNALKRAEITQLYSAAGLIQAESTES